MSKCLEKELFVSKKTEKKTMPREVNENLRSSELCAGARSVGDDA